MTRLPGRLAAAAALAVVVIAVVGVSGRQADVVLVGRVVDAVTGMAVPEAVVTMAGVSTETVETSGGRFSFALPSAPGRMRLSATAPGYLRGFPGQRGATDNLGGTWSIDPTPGRSIEDVVIRLWREASISGRIVDEDQQPIAGATLLVMTRVFTGSGFRWNEARVSSPRTDDRGQFSVAELLPGDYLIAARPPVDPRAGADATPPVTYYPGTQIAAEAQMVPLMSGIDARLDLTINFSAALGVVRGRLTGVEDFSGFWVHLVPEGLLGATSALPAMVVTASAAPVGGFATPVAADGTFTFRAVPRGPYRVKTWRFPDGAVRFAIAGDFQRSISGTFGPASNQSVPATSSDITWIADVPVVVEDEAPVDLVVPLSAGTRVRGRVQFDGAKPLTAAEIASIPVVVRPADGAALGPVPAGRIEADGTFSSPGLPPGDYVIGLGQASGRAQGWSVASILAQGRDVVAGTVSVGLERLDGVVIRVTDRPTLLAGTLRDSRGQVVRDGRVIVFPLMASERDQFHAVPAQRRVVQALTDRDGRFAASVPPGGYLVAPVAGDLPVFWMAPEHLASLAAVATDVRVPEGRETTVNVTLR